jgi:hypothetical protein
MKYENLIEHSPLCFFPQRLRSLLSHTATKKEVSQTWPTGPCILLTLDLTNPTQA